VGPDGVQVEEDVPEDKGGAGAIGPGEAAADGRPPEVSGHLLEVVEEASERRRR
jgi:hypothetical protein